MQSEFNKASPLVQKDDLIIEQLGFVHGDIAFLVQ